MAPLVDAATVACELGVSRDFVYRNAGRFGAVKLGDSPKAPLRFDLARIRQSLTPVAPLESGAVAVSATRPRRSRVPLLPVRGARE